MILATKDVPYDLSDGNLSSYKDASLYNISKSTLVLSNPRIACMMLCLDHAPRSASRISEEIERELNVYIRPDLNTSNLITPICSFTHFAGFEKVGKRVHYWKKFDGFVFGDIGSKILLDASHFLAQDNLHTTYKVFGRASSREGTGSQLTTLLLLLYLYESNPREKKFTVKDAVEGLFGKSKNRIEYTRKFFRLTGFTLPRLTEVGIIKYERSRKKPRVHELVSDKVTEDDVEKLKERYAIYEVYKFNTYYPRVINALRNGRSTSGEISEKEKIDRSSCSRTLRMLRYLGKIKAPQEEYKIHKTELGERFFNEIREIAEISGLIDKIERLNGKPMYDALNEKQKIDFKRLKEIREEKIDPIASDEDEKREFARKCKNVLYAYSIEKI